MGYRSEVAVALKSNKYSSLIEGADLPFDLIKNLIDEADIHKKDGGVLLYWDHVKWYYHSVDAFMASLRKIDPEDWIFFEIGEDLEDNKIEGHWWDNPFNLNINRSLHIET